MSRTRSDFDGLVCAVLLNELELIDEITFVHPKDMQDGKVEVSDRDITTNLPYVPGVYLAFDHHESETVRNTGEVAAQLISRHWLIVDAMGHTEEVKGLGVVGHQPLLKPGETFQYTSGARLRTATGTMRGSYFCVAEDGERFEAPVPEFTLRADGASSGDAPARVLH